MVVPEYGRRNWPGVPRSSVLTSSYHQKHFMQREKTRKWLIDTVWDLLWCYLVKSSRVPLGVFASGKTPCRLAHGDQLHVFRTRCIKLKLCVTVCREDEIGATWFIISQSTSFYSLLSNFLRERSKLKRKFLVSLLNCQLLIEMSYATVYWLDLFVVEDAVHEDVSFAKVFIRRLKCSLWSRAMLLPGL